MIEDGFGHQSDITGPLPRREVGQCQRIGVNSGCDGVVVDLVGAGEGADNHHGPIGDDGGIRGRIAKAERVVEESAGIGRANLVREEGVGQENRVRARSERVESRNCSQRNSIAVGSRQVAQHQIAYGEGRGGRIVVDLVGHTKQTGNVDWAVGNAGCRSGRTGKIGEEVVRGGRASQGRVCREGDRQVCADEGLAECGYGDQTQYIGVPSIDRRRGQQSEIVARDDRTVRAVVDLASGQKGSTDVQRCRHDISGVGRRAGERKIVVRGIRAGQRRVLQRDDDVGSDGRLRERRDSVEGYRVGVATLQANEREVVARYGGIVRAVIAPVGSGEVAGDGHETSGDDADRGRGVARDENIIGVGSPGRRAVGQVAIGKERGVGADREWVEGGHSLKQDAIGVGVDNVV